MNNRNEALEGINFVTEEGISGTLKINSEDCVHVYQKPPIPDGYEYLSGKKYEGWKIRRISDGSTAFWLPVESLDADGSLDNVHFTEKFGRRYPEQNQYYYTENFSDPMNGEIFNQIINCRRFGGIYIFEYPISINPETKKPQAVDTENPYKISNYLEAKVIAANMDTRPEGTVKTHLLYGAEWDSLIKWIEISGFKLDESLIAYHKWTQEKYSYVTTPQRVLRGGGIENLKKRITEDYSYATIPAALSIQC